MTTTSAVLPRWTIGTPIAAWIILGASYVLPGYGFVLALVGVALAGAVFAAVHHAEVVAHRVGEPFGTLVLAVAVTVIEVALIVSVMLTSGPEKAGLARDTVFAAVMIVCNGIVGICLLVGGIRHREQDFQARGAAATLAVLASLSVLTLVMPNFTTTRAGPLLSSSQLAFAGVSSLVLYGVFVFVQTVRPRDYFLAATHDTSAHAAPPPPWSAS
jgi:Ca2+:H+ antiporter